jgi:hypothetical protein
VKYSPVDEKGRVVRQGLRLFLGLTIPIVFYMLISVLNSENGNDKVDIRGSVIVELAEYLGTTTGYLLNGEVGNVLGEEEK